MENEKLVLETLSKMNEHLIRIDERLTLIEGKQTLSDERLARMDEDISAAQGKILSFEQKRQEKILFLERKLISQLDSLYDDIKILLERSTPIEKSNEHSKSFLKIMK